MEKWVSDTCRSYSCKRYKCAEKGIEKGGCRPRKQINCWTPFWSKTDSKIHQKNDHPKTWNLMPKGFQKGTGIDAKTHRKSMPKLVTKKIRKIIKNHVSLNGKNIEIHCKNKCSWWFRRLHVRKGKVSTKHAKWDQSPSENLWKIDTKVMLEKGVHKTWKFIKKVIQKGGGQL